MRVTDVNVLIVIETCFGNTARFAEAVSAGLTAQGATVTVTNAEQCRAELLEGVNLLLVGAPTHNRGLPDAASRRTTAAQGATPATTGVSEWLDGLGSFQGRAAAFDSVSGTSFWNGSAAKKILRRLRPITSNLAGSQSFVVSSTEGPAADGELERAQKWGASLFRPS